MAMTLQQAKRKAKVKTNMALADKLKISKGAISQWNPDEVPYYVEMHLRYGVPLPKHKPGTARATA